MTDELRRFPSIHHLAWQGPTPLRAEKLVSVTEAERLLDGEVSVEEKVDGANLGLSVSASGVLRLQNRGAWLGRDRRHGQFESLWSWLAPREERLRRVLPAGHVLFGEWCLAIHSVEYDQLPDWFLGFDVLDTTSMRFWSAARRDVLLDEAGLAVVPTLARGRFDLAAIRGLIGRSRLGSESMEGVVVRRDAGDWLEARAKLVAAGFTQAIEKHWTKRPLRRNRLAARPLGA